MPSNRDIRLGRVPAENIEGGVIVSPGLQINEMTLEEHQERNRMFGLARITRAEAERSYDADEADEVFGPAAAS